MEKLDDKDLCNIKGGFTMTPWIALGIAAVVIFISGILEGITNPNKCNS